MMTVYPFGGPLTLFNYAFISARHSTHLMNVLWRTSADLPDLEMRTIVFRESDDGVSKCCHRHDTDYGDNTNHQIKWRSSLPTVTQSQDSVSVYPKDKLSVTRQIKLFRNASADRSHKAWKLCYYWHIQTFLVFTVRKARHKYNIYLWKFWCTLW